MASSYTARALSSRVSKFHTVSLTTSHRAPSIQSSCRTSSIPAQHISSRQPRRFAAGFHSTPRRQGLPVIPFLATIFKASGGLELARTAGRIALTFIPILMLGKMKEKRAIQYAAIHGIPLSDEKKEAHTRNLRRKTRLLQMLILIPFSLFWSTMIGSLEQTPLTGRWRTILLSPDEEDEIAAQLAGSGWYNAVGDILTCEGATGTLPSSDWRYQWVQDTLRQLESSLPILSSEPEFCPNWIERGPNDFPLPPPARYPLRPRPRASEYLHWFCDTLTTPASEKSAPPLVIIPGPPYSLIVVDKPDSMNAFSYGFGPNGGSGIVVYSGFLDDIIAKNPSIHQKPPPPKSVPWSWLFGNLGSSSTHTTHPKPTEEQTDELAILLAHEMAHLVLAHHLESLSSFEVVIPGAVSILSDIVRVIIFPFTAVFGPFVNDAVAQLGNVGSGELAKISEYCTTKKQEIEADVVSARILAHAGFDARKAVRFWERRSGEDVECARLGKSQEEDIVKHLERKITSSTHPIGPLRIQSLRDELERWEEERQKAFELQK